MLKKRELRIIAISIIWILIILNTCMADINTGGVYTGSGNAPTKSSGDQEKKGVVYSGSGGRSVFVSATGPETPVEIKKFVDPYLKEGYLVNNEIGVSVEVRNLMGEKIERLSICERIDDNLILEKNSNCYIASASNYSWIVMNKLKTNENIERTYFYDNITPIRNDNKTMTINIGYLGPKSRAIYYYKLRPEEAGKFLLGTSVTFSDDKYQDIDYYMESECNNPIKVAATPEKIHLYTGWLNEWGGGSSTLIKYKIKYQNISEYCHNNRTIAEIDTSEYYDIKNIIKDNLPIIFDEDKIKKRIRFYLNDSEDSLITLDVNYNKDNAYSIPALYIGNNPYPDDPKTITVEDYFNSRSNFFTFVLLFAVNIITLIFIVIPRGLQRGKPRGLQRGKPQGLQRVREFLKSKIEMITSWLKNKLGKSK